VFLFLIVIYLWVCVDLALLSLRWHRRHPQGADAYGKLSARALFVGLLALLILWLWTFIHPTDWAILRSSYWEDDRFQLRDLPAPLLLIPSILPLAGAIPAMGKKANLMISLAILAFLTMSTFTLVQLLSDRLFQADQVSIDCLLCPHPNPGQRLISCR
jgi:hypothetical protein